MICFLGVAEQWDELWQTGQTGEVGEAGGILEVRKSSRKYATPRFAIDIFRNYVYMRCLKSLI
jgi:hypothetical protein